MSMPTTDLTTVSDSDRTIFSSAARFFSGTLLSRISGFVRDICLAYAFGTQSAVAALLVAFRFAHLLRRLLGEGAMQTAFIPLFEELRQKNPQCAGRFFCDLTATLTHLLFLVILVVMVALGALLKWGHLASGNQDILWLTLLMMPSLLFICLFGINAAFMQCEKSFFASSVAPVAFNVCWIMGIAFTSQLPIAHAMTLLSFFVIGACFAQWIVTIPKTYTILKSFGINSLWKNSTCYSKDVIRLGKPLALGIVGVGASQINNALDAVFARWADEEGPAILWYAIRLQQLPLALFGIAIANALLPPLTRALKANNTIHFRRFLDFAIHRTLILMIPISVALFLFGDACVHLIYGHGDFTAVSVISTSWSLWGYTVGLLPMALILILAPAFYAKENYHLPSQAAVGSMILNALLNALFIALLGYGAAGIALATSLSAWANFFWLGLLLEREVPWVSRQLVANTLKIVLATVIATLAVGASPLFLKTTLPVLEILKNGVPTYALSFLGQGMNLGLNGLIFLVAFFISAYFLKCANRFFRVGDFEKT